MERGSLAQLARSVGEAAAAALERQLAGEARGLRLVVEAPVSQRVVYQLAAVGRVALRYLPEGGALHHQAGEAEALPYRPEEEAARPYRPEGVAGEEVTQCRPWEAVQYRRGLAWLVKRPECSQAWPLRSAEEVLP